MDNSFLHRSKLRALFRVVHRNDGNTLQYSEWQIFGHSRIYHQYFLAVHRWRRRGISRRAYHDRETRGRRKKEKKEKKNENQKILTLGPLSPRTFDSSRSLRSSLFDTCSPRHQVHQERILDSLPSSRSTSHSKVLSTTVLIFTHNTRFINLHGDHFPYM